MRKQLEGLIFYLPSITIRYRNAMMSKWTKNAPGVPAPRVFFTRFQTVSGILRLNASFLLQNRNRISGCRTHSSSLQSFCSYTDIRTSPEVRFHPYCGRCFHARYVSGHSATVLSARAAASSASRTQASRQEKHTPAGSKFCAVLHNFP